MEKVQRKKMSCGWKRRKRARPAEILAAAGMLIREQGEETMRMGDIAACAGITKGTIYLYFRNKAELVETLMPLRDHAIKS